MRDYDLDASLKKTVRFDFERRRSSAKKMAKIKFESLSSPFLQLVYVRVSSLLSPFCCVWYLQSRFYQHIVLSMLKKKKIEKAFSKLENEIIINDHYCCYV